MYSYPWWNVLFLRTTEKAADTIIIISSDYQWGFLKSPLPPDF
jgi:hypothetical protein